MFQVLVITLGAIALLFVTWHTAEWACRRMTARYAGRRRMWRVWPDDESDGDSAQS